MESWRCANQKAPQPCGRCWGNKPLLTPRSLVSEDKLSSKQEIQHLQKYPEFKCAFPLDLEMLLTSSQVSVAISSVIGR
jgi:hypothetical protein